MTNFTQFRSKLAQEYSNFDEWKRLAESVGLDPADISLSGKSNTVISNILRAVQQQEKLDSLESFLTADNPHLLPDAKAYIDEIRKAEDSLEKMGNLPTLTRYLTHLLLGFLAACLGLGAIISGNKFGILIVVPSIMALIIDFLALRISRNLLWQGRADKLLGVIRSGVLILLIILSIAGGLLWYKSWKTGKQPNFIIQFEEQNIPVAGQKAFIDKVVSEVSDRDRIERKTNESGQIFLSLQSGTLYTGGIRVERDNQVRNCVFPGFTPSENERQVTHDLDKIYCSKFETPTIGSSIDFPNITTVSQLGISNEIPKNLDVAKLNSLISDVATRNAFIGSDHRKIRTPLGTPSAPLIVDHLAYTLGYDPTIRSPLWVSYLLDSSKKRYRLERSAFTFDPSIPEELQTGPDAYLRNPYDRGHLVSRMDISYGNTESEMKEAQDQASYYTSVVPKADVTNRKSWLNVELFSRGLSEALGPIYVSAGPIYPDLQSNNARLTIGPDNTPVPLALFRVLLRKSSSGSWQSIGFIVPNDGSVATGPEAYIVSVQDIEKQTGLKFFSDLNSDQLSIKNNASIEAFRK